MRLNHQAVSEQAIPGQPGFAKPRIPDSRGTAGSPKKHGPPPCLVGGMFSKACHRHQEVEDEGEKRIQVNLALIST